MTTVLATEVPLPGVTHEALRVERRLAALAGQGGGVLIAPNSSSGPLMMPGIRHLDPGVPIGARPEHFGEIICDVVQRYVTDNRPDVVHCLRIRSAIGAMTGARGTRVVLEAGQMPSQMIRDGRRELPAAQVLDLVELEDKALTRANILIARNQLEAATLVGRGASSEKVLIAPDGLPVQREVTPISQLPSIAAVVKGTPEADLTVLISALVRLKRPFRLTIFHDGDTLRPEMIRELKGSSVGARVELVPIGEDMPLRLVGAQVMVSAPQPGRSLAAGGWLPESVPWALAVGRPVVAPDVGAVRAYAGGGANYYEAGNSGALYERLEELLGDSAIRDEALERIRDRRGALSWDQSNRTVNDVWTIQRRFSEDR